MAVLVGVVERRDVGVEVEAIGKVVPVASVAVKPQVTGRVSEVKYEEGGEVAEGDVLVTIDARPFEVARAQAEAELAEAVSRSENAREQARRYTELNRSGGASKEQIEQYVAAARQAEAQVESAKAAVEKAGLEVSYCTIRAAIRGRAGRRLVTAGNVVTANTTDLVVVNQMAPIDVVFALPEQRLGALQSGLAAGPLKVTAVTPGADSRRVEGEVRFLDNAVKEGSGTIDLKARFANDPPVLWPGQFVTVTVELGVERGVLVVPAAALQAGPDGPFLYVVGQGDVVAVRPVQAGRTVAGVTVVTGGVEAGERVVTDGHGRLAPGARVLVKESFDAATADAVRAARPRP